MLARLPSRSERQRRDVVLGMNPCGQADRAGAAAAPRSKTPITAIVSTIAIIACAAEENSHY